MPAEAERLPAVGVPGEPAPPRADGAWLLAVYAGLLLLVPAKLTIGPLGGVGSPAMLWSLALLAVWSLLMIAALRPSSLRIKPTRRAMLLWMGAVCTSLVVVFLRPTNAGELQSAITMVLLVAGWLGVVAMASDGIPDKPRLVRLLDVISLLAGLFAGFAVFQYLTGQAWVDQLSIPGLTANQSLSGLGTRNGVARPASTASHPIEFGAIVATLLPILLHVGFHHDHLGRVRRWWPVLASAIALPLAISRSAIICVAVALVVLIPTWPARRREGAVLILGFFGITVFVAFPGVIGTFLDLFSGVGTDTSAQSRTESYSLAWAFIEQAPLFGRGPGTFLPEYRILDNQYLLSTIETGLVGMLAVLGVFVTAATSLWVLRRHLVDARERHLAQAVIAAVCAAGAGLAFFDAFSFSMFAGTAFLVVGLSAAVWTLNADAWNARRAPAAPEPADPAADAPAVLNPAVRPGSPDHAADDGRVEQ